MAEGGGELAHGSLLAIGNQNELSGRGLGGLLIASEEATSLELDDVVDLEVVAGGVHEGLGLPMITTQNSIRRPSWGGPWR